MADSISVELSRYPPLYRATTRSDDGHLLIDTFTTTLEAGLKGEELDRWWPAESRPNELTDLWTASREARLFEDREFGQWGLVLLSPERALEATLTQRTERAGDFLSDDIVIGRFLGDLDLLVMEHVATRTRRVRVALPLYPRSDWPVVADTLAQFLHEYCDAHGQKYWERVQRRIASELR